LTLLQTLVNEISRALVLALYLALSHVELSRRNQWV
jgi:hypothetical protein